MKISQIISFKTKNDMNIDIKMDDLDEIFSYEGFSYIKTINCKKMEQCIEKIKNFKFTPKGVVIKFEISENLPDSDIYDFLSIIEELAHEDADMIFGYEFTKNEEIKINLIFIGINLNC